MENGVEVFEQLKGIEVDVNRWILTSRPIAFVQATVGDTSIDAR
jgi:hypothetical protein